MLPEKLMNHKDYDRFDARDLLEQKHPNGERLNSALELREAATSAEQNFRAIMTKLVRNGGLDAQAQVKTQDGNTVMLNEDMPFTVLTMGPLKTEARITQKANNECDGHFWEIFDVVRCSVIVSDEDQLHFLAKMLMLQKRRSSSEEEKHSRETLLDDHYITARLKNRFKEPFYRGHRDALFNIVVKRRQVEANHVCEVQLHLAELMVHKERTHKLYEYFRSYFDGSGPEEDCMKALDCIRGFAGNVDQMIESILRGSDLDQLNHLASLMDDLMGDVHMTLSIRKRIFDLDESNLGSQRAYGLALLGAGKFLEAEEVFTKLLTLMKPKLGASHPDTVFVTCKLASLLRDRGELDEVKRLCRDALECKNVHPHALVITVELIVMLQDQDKGLEAEPLLRQLHENYRQHLGAFDPRTLECTNNLARLLRDQRKLEEAAALYRAVLDGTRRRWIELPIPHPETLAAINNLAVLLQEQGKLEDAGALLQEARDGAKKRWGNSHPGTMNAVNNLALLFEKQGRFDEAEQLFEEALKLREEQLGKNHPATFASRNNLFSLRKLKATRSL